MSWASARRAAGIAAMVLWWPACISNDPERPRPIGEAYVAPESLDLRQEITLNSPVTGTAKGGERVEILQRRRRFVKVRTAGNKEGWTEMSKLLTPEIRGQIAELGRQAAKLPTHGVYRARDTLNVHIEPYRSSPTLYQLKEEDTVEMLSRRVAERTPQPVGAPPSNQPKQYDDWCLVRTAGKRAGWVMARMIDAAIPDEVAQYADGRRITAYFSLGEVVDGDQTKKIWLWTTIERGLESYDFDAVRVFNWGRRRHRYETAYRESKLKGFFPITVEQRVETRYGEGPGFSFVVEKKDGLRYKRRYVMIGFRVRLYAEEPV